MFNKNLNLDNTRDFEITSAILIFFQKIFNQLYERGPRVGYENLSLRSQKVTLDFKKNSWRSKNWPKIA